MNKNKSVVAKQRAKDRLQKRKEERPRSHNNDKKSVEVAKKKAQKAADEVMKKAGGHGTNVLALVDDAPKILSAAPNNYDPQLDVEPSIQSSALYSLALGIVLAAKRRGWSGTNSASDAYLALRYLVDCFTASIEGAVLTFQSAPRWFWELCAALRPKSKNFGTGRIYYEGTIVQNTSPSYASGRISFFTGKYTVVLAATPTQADPLVVYNGFRAITPYSGPYTPELGIVAFNAMWSVFAQIKGTPTERVSAIGEDSILKNDASAFAWSTTSIGTADNAPGGLVTEVLSEIYPVCPILSKLCLNNQISVPEGQGTALAQRRTFHRFVKSGGTASYIGPRMAEFSSAEYYRNPVPARFKFYNFDEYVEQAALIMALAQENMSQAQGYQVTSYPLTSQEFQIMLRQTLIPFFNNEMAQDLIIQDDGILREMIPLVVGDNGVSLTIATGAPLFPQFFSEMVRGASRLTKHLEQRSKKGAPALDLVPILVRPGGVSQLTEYLYTDRDGNSVFLFAQKPGEVPVNLIDCSVTDGNNTFYLNLNGSTLGKLVEDHNAWMTKHTGFFTGLSPLIQSNANPLFSTIVFDSHVSVEVGLPVPVNTPPAPGGKKAPEPKKKNVQIKGTTYDVGAGVSVSNLNSYLVNWETRKLAAYVPILSPEHAKWIQMSITPIIARIASGTISGGDDSVYLSSCYKEAHSYMMGNSNVDESDAYSRYSFANLFEKHLRAAAVDVKAGYAATESDIEVILNTFSKEGEGSFLSTLSSILTWTGKFLAGI